MMFKSIFKIFRKQNELSDPLRGYSVGDGFDLLINCPNKIEEWSICQICLELVENSSRNVPEDYWCCPECASEAIEIPYVNLKAYFKNNSLGHIEQALVDWENAEGFIPSYKLLKELRYKKLIELSKATQQANQADGK